MIQRHDPTSDRWRACATDSLDAARVLLRRGHIRSCISRAYYAAFCAAHALAVRANQTPPARGNWGHEEIGEVFHAVTASAAGRAVGMHHAQMLGSLLARRRTADYKPKIRMLEDEARLALRESGRVVQWVEGRLA